MNEQMSIAGIALRSADNRSDQPYGAPEIRGGYMYANDQPGLGIDVDGSWNTLIDEIAASGANAIRVLPNLEQLSVADVDGLLTRIESLPNVLEALRTRPG